MTQKGLWLKNKQTKKNIYEQKHYPIQAARFNFRFVWLQSKFVKIAPNK